MSMQASVVLNRVRFTMLDPGDIGWTQPEKLDYLNQALTAVSMLKADAYQVTAQMALTAGPSQALPVDGNTVGQGGTTLATGHLVIDVIANGGSTGNAVMEVGRESLTAANRAWFNAPQQPTFDEWMFDKRTPLLFYVNPPNDGTGTAIVRYGAIHPRLTLETGGTAASTIVLPDTYESALWAHVCSSCYAKNTERQDLVKSSGMMQLFVALVTGRTASIEKVSPKHQLPQGTAT